MPEKVNGNKFNGKSNIESLNSNHSPLDSKSTVQLNSKEHKLATIQKMADNTEILKEMRKMDQQDMQFFEQPISDQLTYEKEYSKMDKVRGTDFMKTFPELSWLYN
jgi:hypothetical protein